MQKLSFVRQFEKYSPKVNVGVGADTLTLFLDFPVVLQDIQGAKKRLRYDEVLVKGESYIAKIQTEDLMGNVFSITDTWTTKDGLIQIDREVTYSEVKKETAVRLTTEFDLVDSKAKSFDDYGFIIPGALYNKNDTDHDGIDDYLATFNQDYKDDRNLSLSVTA